MNTPTERSLKLLRQEGYTVAVTEHFNPFAHIRQDLFGFIDMVAMIVPDNGVLAVQTTSFANRNARVEKIMSLEVAHTWLLCGNRIEVHGWKKVGKKGEFQRYEVDRQEITLDDWDKAH